MMQADVKAIQANDVLEWQNWQPQNDQEELQWFTVTIGTVDTNGGECFQVLIATPKGLKTRRHKEKFQGIIVQSFTKQEIEIALKTTVGQVTAERWEDIVYQLKPTFIWEYEGHP